MPLISSLATGLPPYELPQAAARDFTRQHFAAAFPQIERYLPAELGEEELDALVREAIAATGAAGPRDMGRAIQHTLAAAGGRADGRRVSAKVKEALAA